MPAEELKKLGNRAKDSMLKSSTSVDPLNSAIDVVKTLTQQFRDNQAPVLTNEQKSYLYKDFFKEISDKSAISEVQNPASQVALTELMQSLIALLA